MVHVHVHECDGWEQSSMKKMLFYYYEHCFGFIKGFIAEERTVYSPKAVSCPNVYHHENEGSSRCPWAHDTSLEPLK